MTTAPGTSSPEVRELARRLVAAESAGSRATQLEHSSLEDGALREFDLYGIQVAQYGKQWDDVHKAPGT